MLTDSEADFVSVESDSESDSKGLLDVEETSNKSENENVSSDEESENCSLESLNSDLVWGKVSSYPWWPGQVFLDSSVASSKAKKHFKKKGTFLVAYFGDFSFAWNDVSKMKPFHQHFSQMAKQSDDSPEFRNAVGCALEEVSRRVEFGLSCGCVSEGAYYERVKSQKVMNPGVREESRVRYGGDKASDAEVFEPGKLVEYVKALACCPRYDDGDKLMFVSKRAQVLAFQRWTSYLNFPLKDMIHEKTEEKTLSDCVADKSVEEMVGKKRKVESLELESGKPEKKIKNKRQKPCFLMGAIPLRMESEMMTTRTLKPLGDSNSISKLEVENQKIKKLELNELAQEKFSPHIEMIPSRKRSPQPLILEHSNYEDFEKFIEEMSCSNLNHDPEKASITEISEPSDVKASSDQHILPENKDIPGSGSEDCSGDSSAPNALILKFASSGSVPSEEKLNSIFNRYGPLRETETRVMKKAKKARVVFRRGEDAKTAFSSSGKYSIFGPSLLSYGLKHVGQKAKEGNELTE